MSTAAFEAYKKAHEDAAKGDADLTTESFRTGFFSGWWAAISELARNLEEVKLLVDYARKQGDGK